MKKLSRAELWSLEQYAVERAAFRNQVIAHKVPRRIALGPHATLLFEDFLTMKYQVQEMLRVERIFEPAAIEEEIETYNPLVPMAATGRRPFSSSTQTRKNAPRRWRGCPAWSIAFGCKSARCRAA